MDRSRDLANLAANLALLVASYDSVADFCRRLNINRQQFNKYLAAHHVPSQKVLLKIAKFFLMEPADLFRNPADFRGFYEGLEHELPIDLKGSPGLARFLPLIESSTTSLQDFLGVYYRYHQSSIYKGRVLRSVTCLYQHDAMVEYVTVERFPLLGQANRVGYSFTYRGYCFLLGDRIFMVDFEGRQKNEMTFSVLTPQHRRPIRFLYGLLTGVASSSFRQPFSTRLAFGFVERGPIRKRHLRQATILAPGDDSIPVEVEQYLSGEQAHVVWGGEG
ncbi:MULTISPECIES: helix-turn-helix transcriptional regulator [Burkholderia]|jgi:transcriptional regulator with XRE-family HTH domain|uniref:helix-turn-helix domain-containing protein n=1 Tax=Burkholderia TaxID=32008 RepID=UPI00046AD0C1|nr:MULTISPECIES: helix-turn-helix transcriptional regulator [Burkholderia]NIE86199.1 helix-turn-helix transcriptional regulator [Burkholderia sp. Tr-860]NIF65206.1 helix-turn-helix transcriptional regulator [Burkholderia sp. Cy-647]NIF74168.1 helix-turn-helix transcriptional regulator [Burkholderia sp. Ap-962]NIF87292.1 helix-turn-helix transcriptional regulator [Burkholderia sp. Cy-637]NIF96240.1 helix-turn-helix transcriptional regulator [Burkholderia sp. Ax-1720]